LAGADIVWISESEEFEFFSLIEFAIMCWSISTGLVGFVGADEVSKIDEESSKGRRSGKLQIRKIQI
jgi:hypothetical protein